MFVFQLYTTDYIIAISDSSISCSIVLNLCLSYSNWYKLAYIVDFDMFFSVL